MEAQRACGNDAKLVLLPESKHAFILFGYTATVEETMAALGEIHHFLSETGFWAAAADSRQDGSSSSRGRKA